MRTIEFFTDNKTVKGSVVNVHKTLTGNVVIEYTLDGMDDKLFYAPVTYVNGVWTEDEVKDEFNNYVFITDDYYKVVFDKYQLGTKVKVNSLPEIHVNLNTSSDINSVIEETVYIMFNGDKMVAFNFFEKQYGDFYFSKKAISTIEEPIYRGVISEVKSYRISEYKNIKVKLDSNSKFIYDNNGDTITTFAKANRLSLSILVVKANNELIDACLKLRTGYPINIIPGLIQINSKIYNKEVFLEDEVTEPVRAFILGVTGNLDMVVGDYKYITERY